MFRVDERGAEGAAATAVAMPGSAPRETAFTVTVDRPFLFVLRRRGAVLFLGRVTDPEDPVAPAERERWREAPRLRIVATPDDRRREPRR
ncbi:serpin family protein [Nocardiopsis aegyptia]|uniref:serpin family protein n=1 Tax=Nocardiopsis aegyptia TaxID=220378 RepID=UPI0015C96A91|nr:serpin family protein [Nocardiopsis aegyptia]